MTKLTELRGSECLPKPKNFYSGTRDLGERPRGFNEAVSQLEQVELCVDETVLRDLIFDEMKKSSTHGDRFIFNFSANTVAKSLSQSKEKWLKLEVRK